MIGKTAAGIIFILLCSTNYVSAQDERQGQYPNFIVIFADDLGYGDVGSAGSGLIQTPHIDRMQAEGVTLTNHYSSANVCTPSRAGLLTGRYPVRTGLAHGVLRFGDDYGLSHDEITIAGALREKGYRTAMFGKWHLGTVDVSWPTQHGFDYFYGLPYSNDMLPLALYRNSEVIEEPVDQTTITKRYTNEAIRFIEKRPDDPFFIYIPHSMPHTPLHVSGDFEGRSKAGLYGDVIEEIDWSVGKILHTIKRLGLDKNTLVIFTSDNGPWYEGSVGELRDRKGGASWDGGFRVPFIARWPGKIPPDITSEAITMNFDVFPTLLTLAGVDIPDDRNIDGKNIWSVLQGNNQSPHDYLFLFNNEEITAVRSQRWKFVIRSYYRSGFARFYGERGGKPHYYDPGLLFDLKVNPEEEFSFTRDNPDIVEKMNGWLEEGRKELEILGRNKE